MRALWLIHTISAFLSTQEKVLQVLKLGKTSVGNAGCASNGQQTLLCNTTRVPSAEPVCSFDWRMEWGVIQVIQSFNQDLP